MSNLFIKRVLTIGCLLAVLLNPSFVMAVPVISYGDGFVNAEDNGVNILRAVHHYGVEVDGGIPMEFTSGGSGLFDGFSLVSSSSLDTVPSYSGTSSVFQNSFTVTNTSAIAKSFAISTYIDVDIFSPTALAGCAAFIGDPVSCDSAVFNAATNSLITSNLFDPTLFALSVNTSVSDANLAYKVGSYDDADLAWYSTLNNSGEGGIGDIALGIGFEMLINAGETFTISYDYLVCTDTSGDTCGLTASVPESDSIFLLLIVGALLLLLVRSRNPGRL